MKAIHFEEVNEIYAKNQPQYLELPVLKFDDGTVVTCWKLSFRDKIRIIFKGKIWLELLTFNKPLQPIYMTTKKKEVIQIDGELDETN